MVLFFYQQSHFNRPPLIFTFHKMVIDLFFVVSGSRRRRGRVILEAAGMWVNSAGHIVLCCSLLKHALHNIQTTLNKCQQHMCDLVTQANFTVSLGTLDKDFFIYMCVCFRTSTSACLCLLTSESLTATWRSCSLAAHPSTNRSADVRAEPRWSVCARACLFVSVLLLLCGTSSPVTRHPLCRVSMVIFLVQAQDGLICSHMRSPHTCSL